MLENAEGMNMYFLKVSLWQICTIFSLSIFTVLASLPDTIFDSISWSRASILLNWQLQAWQVPSGWAVEAIEKITVMAYYTEHRIAESIVGQWQGLYYDSRRKKQKSMHVG